MSLTMILSAINWRVTGAALVIAIAFSFGWQIRSWRCDAATAKMERQVEARRAELQLQADQAAKQFEEKLARAILNQRDLTRRLDREIQDDAYRCRVPLDGVRLFNEAVSSGDSPSQPDGPAPRR